MSITHEEARNLIQFKADRVLNAHDLTSLDAHLEICHACADYADQIKSMELNLREVMKKQWSASPLPLRIQDVRGKNISQGWLTSFLPTRKLLIGITTMLFAFAFWQFSVSGGDSSNLTLVAVSPNPTPSASITGTHNEFEACDMLQYTVQDGDTLESIAEKFSVPVEAILNINDLQTGTGLQTQIVIPLCTLTPTSTDHPPASTLTPGYQTFTTTPG